MFVTLLPIKPDTSHLPIKIYTLGYLPQYLRAFKDVEGPAVV
jgi:hypothetical protein